MLKKNLPHFRLSVPAFPNRISLAALREKAGKGFGRMPEWLRWALGFTALYYLVIGSAAVPIYRHSTNRFTAFAERFFPYPAAFVGNQEVLLSRFRKEVGARLTYANAHKLPAQPGEVDRYVMEQLTNRLLYADSLKAHGIAVSAADVNARMDGIYKEIGGQDKLAKFLSENYGRSIGLDDFKVWVQELLAESAVQHQLLAHVEIKHILFALPENPTDAQVEDARRKALDIRSQITDTSKFADFAKRYSEDVASRDQGGELGTAVRGDTAAAFSQEFENAVFSTPAGAITNPIRTKYGWHIVLVAKKEGVIDKTLSQYTADLRAAANIRQYFGS